MVAAGMQLLNMGNCDLRIWDAWRRVLTVNIMWLGSKKDYPFETEKGQELLVNRRSTVQVVNGDYSGPVHGNSNY